MFYRFIKLLLQGTARVFFRSIKISHGDFIPTQGPLIILANHPSTFMDPIVIASVIKRKVYFLGKGELFKGVFAKWILHQLNIIPVFRKQDDPTQLNKNADTFKKCYEHLETGGVILIFPEGISITERKLKPIKAGASHIALGAEARNDFKLGVKIVNIGLNYDNQHQFNRDVYININKPIDVSAYADNFKADKTRTIKELTENITQQLEEVVISIQDSKTDEFVKNIETLYSTQLKSEGSTSTDFEETFYTTQYIIKAVNYFLETDAAFVESIQSRIKIYFKNLASLKLDDADVIKNDSSFLGENIKEFLYLVLGLPIYLFGLINNILPFEIPGWIATKMVKSKDYKGAIGMILGMFTFSLFYGFQIILFQHLFHQIVFTFLYAISLPASGFFTYYYWHNFDRLKAKWTFNYLFNNRTALIENLIAERSSIIREFEQAKNKFVAHSSEIAEGKN
jgi:1-acyl-sn-glycerol-3-phosphate acyltransferase